MKENLSKKERFEDTVNKKSNPLTNIIDMLLSPFKKPVEKSPEQLAKEREEFANKIEGLSVEDIISPVDIELILMTFRSEIGTLELFL
jgi:hypothetical protein